MSTLPSVIRRTNNDTAVGTAVRPAPRMAVTKTFVALYSLWLLAGSPAASADSIPLELDVVYPRNATYAAGFQFLDILGWNLRDLGVKDGSLSIWTTLSDVTTNPPKFVSKAGPFPPNPFNESSKSGHFHNDAGSRRSAARGVQPFVHAKRPARLRERHCRSFGKLQRDQQSVFHDYRPARCPAPERIRYVRAKLLVPRRQRTGQPAERHRRRLYPGGYVQRRPRIARFLPRRYNPGRSFCRIQELSFRPKCSLCLADGVAYPKVEYEHRSGDGSNTRASPPRGRGWAGWAGRDRSGGAVMLALQRG